MLLELTRDLTPGVTSLYEGAPCQSQRLPADGIVEQRHDGACKILRVVGHDKLPARRDRQSFRADGRRDDGLRHGQRFEDLQPCAASRPQRNDIQRCLIDMRADIVHGSSDGNACALGDLPQPRRRVAPDDGEGDIGIQGTDPRQDRLAEVNDRVFIGMPIH